MDKQLAPAGGSASRIWSASVSTLALGSFLLGSSAIISPAMAACVVTGTGTVAAPNSGDVIDCTGADTNINITNTTGDVDVILGTATTPSTITGGNFTLTGGSDVSGTASFVRLNTGSSFEATITGASDVAISFGSDDGGLFLNGASLSSSSASLMGLGVTASRLDANINNSSITGFSSGFIYSEGLVFFGGAASLIDADQGVSISGDGGFSAYSNATVDAAGSAVSAGAGASFVEFLTGATAIGVSDHTLSLGAGNDDVGIYSGASILNNGSSNAIDLGDGADTIWLDADAIVSGGTGAFDISGGSGADILRLRGTNGNNTQNLLIEGVEALQFSANQPGETTLTLGPGSTDFGSLTTSGAGLGVLRFTGDITNLVQISVGEVITDGLGSTAPISVTGSGQLTWDHGLGAGLVVTNAISGDGVIGKAGTGSVDLRNLTGFTGTLEIADGLVFVGNSATSVSSVTLTSASAIISPFASGGAFTFGADISGSGSMYSVSTNAITLTGANTFTGGMQINSGSITGAVQSLGAGDISVNAGASLYIEEAGAATMANNLSGMGNFYKEGAGTVSYTGDAAIAVLQITDGTFRVNTQNFSSATTSYVAPSGVLGGSGVFTGNIAAGGTFAPGNSIGTLTIDGDVTFENGSTLEIEFDSSSIDLLDVSGAATIQSGANLVFIPLTSGAASGGTFLQAAGGVTGTFDNVSVQGGGNIAVAYTTTAAEIGQQAGSGGGTGGGSGGGAGGGSGGGGSPVILSARPDHLSAEATMTGEFAFDVTDLVGGQMLRAAPGGKRRLWGGYVGGFGDRDASGSVNAVNLDHNGFVGGVDYPVTDDLSLGVALGLTGGTAEIDDAASKVSADSFFFLATARTSLAGTTLAGGFVYGDHDLDTHRDVVFNGTPEALSRDTKAKSFGLFLKGRRPVAEVAGASVAITAGVDLWRGAIDAAEDASSNMLALEVGKTIVSGGRFEAGAEASRSASLAGVSTHLYAGAGARYTASFDDRDFHAAFGNGAGPAITLDGDEGGLMQGVFSAGVSFDLTESISAYTDYDAAISGEGADHAVAAGLRLAF